MSHQSDDNDNQLWRSKQKTRYRPDDNKRRGMTSTSESNAHYNLVTETKQHNNNPKQYKKTNQPPLNLASVDEIGKTKKS